MSVAPLNEAAVSACSTQDIASDVTTKREHKRKACFKGERQRPRKQRGERRVKALCLVHPKTLHG
eukprot:144843-Pleurochrysis_carterae.AAC.1